MERIKLSAVCDIQSGGTPSRSKREFWDGGTIPWVKIGDISGKYLDKAGEKITKAGLAGSSAKLFPKGSILFTIFATLGEVAILDIDACTNQAIAGITIQDGCVDSNYLYYFLKSLKAYVNDIGRGVAQNNINMSILRNFEIPLRSLEEQQKIANILDRTYSAINLRKCQLTELDNLVKAQFVEMFGDEMRSISVQDVCRIITDGTHQPPRFVRSGIPFIFVSNLVGNKVTYNAEKFIDEQTYSELIKRTPIEVGDVLLTTVGSYGHAAVVDNDKRFLFQRHIAYLKPNQQRVNSTFLQGFFLSDDGQRQIEAGVKGIAQKTLNLSEIRKMRLPLPSLEQQNSYARFVAQVDKSKAVVQKALDESQTLFDSLMQQYFG